MPIAWVTHIYEKGPQTLTDAISEVEKLNAVQQHHSYMIISPSTQSTWCPMKKITVSGVRNKDI